MATLADAYASELTPDELAAANATDEIAAEEAVAALHPREPVAEEPSQPQREAEAEGEEDAPDTTDAASQPDPEPEPEQEPEPAVETAPQIDVAAAQKALEDARAERKALMEQWNDGDLTDQEYADATEKVDDTAADARAALKMAEHQANAANAEWERAGKAYFNRYPELGKGALNAAFNEAVAVLNTMASVNSLSDAEFLERVHRKLVQDSAFTGLDVPPLAPTKGAKRAPKGDEDLGKPAKTLSGVPSAGISEQGDSMFSRLSKLADTDPAAHEDAMAKLSRAEREQYLLQVD